MNRVDFLKTIGFNYPADFYDVQEVITIKNENPDESDLLLKIENNLHSIKIELRFQTEEISNSIFNAELKVNEINKLDIKNLSFLNSNTTNITNVDELSTTLLQIIKARCYNESCINNTEISI